MRPLLRRRNARQIAIVQALQQDRRRTGCAKALLHPLVEMAVIDLGRRPAHPPDQADFAHFISSKTEIRSPCACRSLSCAIDKSVEGGRSYSRYRKERRFEQTSTNRVLIGT